MTDRAVSLSGKYLLFYGFHYEAGVTCWVIGSSNKATGEIVMRHYNEKIPGCIAPHAVSRTTWDDFRRVMTEKREDAEYEEGYLESLQKYLN
jgi:hypothetical protein